jgi:thiol:disulfide interchange protein DsbA
MRTSIKFWFALLGLISATFAVIAQPMFEEGKQYQKAPQTITSNELVKELAKEANGKVQVLEFFSYGCSWCYKLDPFIEKWRKGAPAHVSFQRIPVEFHPTWEPFTKAYFTEVNLNAVDTIHSPLFEAIQTDKLGDTTPESLKQFFMSKGIKEKDFTEAYESFSVTRKQKWASAISRAYRITSVPAIIVQGPQGTFVTSLRMAGSEDNLLAVIDYLVNMQHQAQPKAESTSPQNKQ